MSAETDPNGRPLRCVRCGQYQRAHPLSHGGVYHWFEAQSPRCARAHPHDGPCEPEEHWESVRDRRRAEAETAEGMAHANAEIAQLRAERDAAVARAEAAEARLDDMSKAYVATGSQLSRVREEVWELFELVRSRFPDAYNAVPAQLIWDWMERGAPWEERAAVREALNAARAALVKP